LSQDFEICRKVAGLVAAVAICRRFVAAANPATNLRQIALMETDQKSVQAITGYYVHAICA